MTIPFLGSCFTVLLAATISDGTAEAAEFDVAFLSQDAGRTAIQGTPDDSFFGLLHRREAAAMTATDLSEKTRAESQQFAKDFFGKAVLPFSAEEQQAVRQRLSEVEQIHGKKYPRLVMRPWRFVKVRADLCGGFSFTRDECIVLSESTLDRFTDAVASGRNASRLRALLLHEQLHVLQRSQPELFQPLYEGVFGFQKAKVHLHPWIDERQVTNPDGVSDDWVVTVEQGGESTHYWLGTILAGEKTVHQMGRDFQGVAVRLTRDDEGTAFNVSEIDGKPEYIPLEDFKRFASRFPISNGLDHPNEMAAYLLTRIAQPQEAEAPAPPNALQQQTAAWFTHHLGNENTTGDPTTTPIKRDNHEDQSRTSNTDQTDCL